MFVVKHCPLWGTSVSFKSIDDDNEQISSCKILEFPKPTDVPASKSMFEIKYSALDHTVSWRRSYSERV